MIVDGVNVGSHDNEIEIIIDITNISLNPLTNDGIIIAKKTINEIFAGEFSYQFVYYPEGESVLKQAENQLLQLEEFSGAIKITMI
jgi:hypothetical protein